MSQRTITLTGRPPVKIDEDNWPVLADASDNEHDGQVQSQANRTSKWWVKVRQHDDGRTLVYAGYDYDTCYRGERGLSAKRGLLLPAGTSNDAICDAIRDVCGDIYTAEHAGEDADRWPTLAAACIADMPAESLE
jgi:hypothetical protein